MPQSLSRIVVHLVFSTKYREPMIVEEDQPRVFAYLAGVLNGMDCSALRVGGMPDHVHALFVLGRTVALCKVVEELKKQSSKWAKESVHPGFYWQNGYGAFSVSASNVPIVQNYIETQKDHHHSQNFQHEFRVLLHRHEMTWDERYIWD